MNPSMIARRPKGFSLPVTQNSFEDISLEEVSLSTPVNDDFANFCQAEANNEIYANWSDRSRNTSNESANQVKGPFRRRIGVYTKPKIALDGDKWCDDFSSSCTDASLFFDDKMPYDGWPKMVRHSSIDDDGRCDRESSGNEEELRKTPTPFDYDNGTENSYSSYPLRDIVSTPDLKRTSSLVDELLNEIYARFGDVTTRSSANSIPGYGIDWSRRASSQESDCFTEYSTTSEYPSKWTQIVAKKSTSAINKKKESNIAKSKLEEKGLSELRQQSRQLETQIQYSMSQLTRQVKRRDRLRHRRERQYNLVTAILQASSQKRRQDTRIRFSLEPAPGDPGFNQWKDAMKMVARLPEGVPEEFRRKLWLTLSEKYLKSRGVDWVKADRFCFNEWSNPDDDELGMQIVRDLHRTGCSLFCGEDAEVNQLMLKRVLLAYARWNKSIGYCQGFNMLAALILEVMDKQESDSLQVMIFMIEGILPECYFTNNLRGLSVDMAVFRDLLKLRLPKLSKHLDDLQRDASDGGTSYEPPLTNVFTMQWFLTLFSTCLPRETVLRVWDLILLEGNEVLLRTALAIWTQLEDRILTVRSADEFYCAMGQLSREMLEYGVVDTNRLVKILVEISPFPFGEVSELREKYSYNITPWSQGLAVAKRGLKILYSDEEDNMDEDEEKIAVAATFGISAVFAKASPRCSPSKLRMVSASKMHGHSSVLGPSQQNVDKERLSVDINALKHQYAKLRQRQKQAHIILTTAWTKQQPTENGGPQSRQGGTRVTNAPPVAMNHLLLGKKPLINAKPRKGPPPGAIPAPKNRVASVSSDRQRNQSTSSSGTSMDATHYTCPQPEIVPEPDLKMDKRHHHRSRPNHSSLSSRENSQNKDDRDSKSNQDVREMSESEDPSSSGEGPPSIIIVQDQSDLPDYETAISSSRQIRGSRSNQDISKAIKVDNHKTRSETDLQQYRDEHDNHNDDDDEDSVVVDSTEKNRQFMEEILNEFDRSSIGTIQGEESEATEREEADGSTENPARRKLQGRQNSLEAMQLIKENSEILGRLAKRQDSIHSDSTTPPKQLSPSPTEQKLPPKRVVQSSPANKPITFNPFPNRQKKKPKEVGLKLGLYPSK